MWVQIGIGLHNSDNLQGHHRAQNSQNHPNFSENEAKKPPFPWLPPQAIEKQRKSAEHREPIGAEGWPRRVPLG